MFIRIETSSGVPITRQIADQIRSHSISGVLAPGDRLPSVRQLAKELAVLEEAARKAVLILCLVPQISTGLPDLIMGPDGSR